MKRSALAKKAVEWTDEAAKIASNQPSAYGSEDGLGDGTSFAVTGHNAALWARASEADRRAVIEAFASNTVATSVAMVNAYINDGLGQAWGSVLTRNSTIQSLNLESNTISSGGMTALAEALRVNTTLTELKLANQHIAFSQQAEMALAEALEGNTALTRCTIELRSSRARELMNKYLARNQDQLRQRRRASAAANTAGAAGAAAAAPSRGHTLTRSNSFARPCDWREEASSIAASRAFRYGGGEVAKEGSYEVTGHNAALWARATGEDRRAVVEAFATNTAVSSVAMVNCFINEALAQAWGGVLARNATITSCAKRLSSSPGPADRLRRARHSRRVRPRGASGAGSTSRATPSPRPGWSRSPTGCAPTRRSRSSSWPTSRPPSVTRRRCRSPRRSRATRR